MLDDSWADEAAFQFYAEDSDRFTGDRDLELARELNPELKSFSDWAAEHKTSSMRQPTDVIRA